MEIQWYPVPQVFTIATTNPRYPPPPQSLLLPPPPLPPLPQPLPLPLPLPHDTATAFHTDEPSNSNDAQGDNMMEAARKEAAERKRANRRARKLRNQKSKAERSQKDRTKALSAAFFTAENQIRRERNKLESTLTNKEEGGVNDTEMVRERVMISIKFGLAYLNLVNEIMGDNAPYIPNKGVKKRVKKGLEQAGRGDIAVEDLKKRVLERMEFWGNAQV
ncbi:hypothetical protein BDD12DRAFT_856202 [Trichophaea hybrida]|nr:hypothetical protein BDD12DRAFT_856202 [Trichophaea hybrida]